MRKLSSVLNTGFFAIITVLLIPSLFGNAHLAEKGTLKVVVNNIDVQASEHIRVGLYNDEEKFPEDEQQYIGKIQDATQSRLTFVFNELPQGTYAVACYQDENRDGDLNTNWLGIPTERYAFSNNATGFMAPPSYKAASFVIRSGQETTIEINL